MSVLIDRTVRFAPGRTWTWARIYVGFGLRDGFESGVGWSYRGLIHRHGYRFGPLELALLRLIGDGQKPYLGAPDGRDLP